jgi:integrase/recombinase XerC
VRGDQLERGESVRGELVSPARELAEAYAATLVASPQTKATYSRACRRFVAWLGPDAGPEALTLRAVSAYHEHLADPDAKRSMKTIKKDRSALNSFIRWCAEHDLVPSAQAKLALSVGLPDVTETDRDIPRALTPRQYQLLIDVAKARKTEDKVRGARDLAIVLVLGDGGLRAEELGKVERRDIIPSRQGANQRVIEIRYGKGGRQRKVYLSERATTAVLEWERVRAQTFGRPEPFDPLFITLGRRKKDGTYTHVGNPMRQWALNDLMKVLGGRAGLPEDLCHPHTLRHTCATEMLRRPNVTITDVQAKLGHADVKTTAIYTRTDEKRQARIARQVEQPVPTIDEDLDLSQAAALAR